MKVRLSNISYANTIPFAYGLHENSYIQKNTVFSSHYPSQGVELMQQNAIDISIIPVAAIPLIPNARIISNYCIAAQGKVDSVLLCSKVPREQITHIALDYQSRTSNVLVQIIAKKLWNINPQYSISSPETSLYSTADAHVIIGDRALENAHNFEYVYDLAEEWYHLYSLPFIFACWITNKEISNTYMHEFEQSLEHGVSHIQESIQYSNHHYTWNLHEYLTQRIEYYLEPSVRTDVISLFYKDAAELGIQPDLLIKG